MYCYLNIQEIKYIYYQERFIWMHAIAHSHSQRPMLEFFPWINQSDIFTLNWSINDVSNCSPLCSICYAFREKSCTSN